MATAPAEVLELRDGARMTQAEFHRAYERTADHVRAELIGGVVRMGGRVTARHGENHAMLGMLVGTYGRKTPGVQACGRTTVILGADSEPEPDLHLRIATEFGGQSRISEDDYLTGAPELVAEVSDSTLAVDPQSGKGPRAIRAVSVGCQVGASREVEPM